jgi:hypothetical protein
VCCFRQTFFTIENLLPGLSSLKAKYPDAPSRLRQAYLEPWVQYAPMDQPRQAFHHAFLPMLMQRALFYSQLPFTQQGLAWERSTVVPSQLRTPLKYMRPLRME